MSIESNIPVRYFLHDSTNISFICALSLVPEITELWLQINFYALTDLRSKDILKKSFEENPTSRSLFRTASTELKVSYKFGMNDAVNLSMELASKLTPDNLNNHIPVTFSNIQISMLYKEVFIINNFINNYLNNYDFFKLTFIKEAEEVKNTTVTTNTNTNTNSPIETNKSTIEIVDNKSKDNTDKLQYILDLFPYDVCKYSLAKMLIDSKPTKLTITENENNILLTLSAITEFYNISMIDDLNICLTELSRDFSNKRQDYIENLKILFRTFYTLINDDSPIDEKTQYLQLITLIMVLYYSRLCNIEHFNSFTLNDYNSLINDCNRTLVNMFYKDIFSSTKQYIFNFVNSDNDENIVTDKLIDTCIKKYSYLKDIDKSSFIESVLGEVDTLTTNKTESNDISFNFLTSGTSIHILDFLSELDEPNERPLLRYKRYINPNLNSNNIISKHYMHILLISDNSTVITMLKDIHPIIKLCSSIIINKIIPELTNNKDMLSMNVSTLILLNTFIKPFMPENTSNFTEMFLLYKIVIPCIYDIFGIDTVLDYFH